MSFTEDFGKRLKYWHEKRGMTALELDELVELSKETNLIPVLEKGRYMPSYDGIRNIAKALGIAPEVLMGGTRKVKLFENKVGGAAIEEILNMKDVESIQYNSYGLNSSDFSQEYADLVIIYWDYDKKEMD